MGSRVSNNGSLDAKNIFSKNAFAWRMGDKGDWRIMMGRCRKHFLDGIISPSTHPCHSVIQWVSHWAIDSFGNRRRISSLLHSLWPTVLSPLLPRDDDDDDDEEEELPGLSWNAFWRTGSLFEGQPTLLDVANWSLYLSFGWLWWYLYDDDNDDNVCLKSRQSLLGIANRFFSD